MTAFDPALAARILSRRAARIRDEAERKAVAAMWMQVRGGRPWWHRVVREMQSEADAAYERLYSLQEHIAWLYAEDQRRRLAEIGLSR